MKTIDKILIVGGLIVAGSCICGGKIIENKEVQGFGYGILIGETFIGTVAGYENYRRQIYGSPEEIIENNQKKEI